MEAISKNLQEVLKLSRELKILDENNKQNIKKKATNFCSEIMDTPEFTSKIPETVK